MCDLLDLIAEELAAEYIRLMSTDPAGKPECGER
jgi:hypothetical protein